jgi:fucose permease
LLLSSIGGTWGYRILGLASLPVALWAFFTPSPPRQAHEEDREGGSLSPFLFVLFCTLTFIFIGGEVGFSGWIYSYAYELNLGTEQTAGMLTSFYWLGITLGRVAAIFTSSRFKPGRIVLANLTGLVVSLGLILLNPASQTLLWIGSLGFGFFLAPVFPTTFAFLERKTPITGTAAGVLWASGSFGAMVYPWVMGLQMANTGPVSIMVTLAVSFGVALVLFSWVWRQLSVR